MEVMWLKGSLGNGAVQLWFCSHKADFQVAMKDAKQASSARRHMHGPVGQQALKDRLFLKMAHHCPRDKVKVKVSRAVEQK